MTHTTLVAIEGIDGAGKNTLAQALSKIFKTEVVSFPAYDTSPFAQAAKEALRGGARGLAKNTTGIALAFALDRIYEKDRLEGPGVVLVDRYVASNVAYSVARTGDGGVAEWIEDLEFGRLCLPKPDLHVLVNTTPKEAKARVEKREKKDSSRKKDLYESNEAFQEAVFDVYQAMAEEEWISPWFVTPEDFNPDKAAQEIHDFLVQERDGKK